MIRLRVRKEISSPVNIFQSDEIRRQIGESIPLTLIHDEYSENDNINANTTKSMFSLNNALAHTKDLGRAKKTKNNYITAFLTKGIRTIKGNKKGQ